MTIDIGTISGWPTKSERIKKLTDYRLIRMDSLCYTDLQFLVDGVLSFSPLGPTCLAALKTEIWGSACGTFQTKGMRLLEIFFEG